MPQKSKDKCQWSKCVYHTVINLATSNKKSQSIACTLCPKVDQLKVGTQQQNINRLTRKQQNLGLPAFQRATGKTFHQPLENREHVNRTGGCLAKLSNNSLKQKNKTKTRTTHSCGVCLARETPFTNVLIKKFKFSGKSLQARKSAPLRYSGQMLKSQGVFHRDFLLNSVKNAF